MNWFSSAVEGAGLSRHGSPTVLVAIISAAVLGGLLTYSISSVVALGLIVFFGLIGFLLEALFVTASARKRQLAKLWPEVLDCIQSAVSSGSSLSDSVSELAQNGPAQLRGYFDKFSNRIDSGWSFDQAIDETKAEFGNVNSDRLMELLRLVSHSGAVALPKMLREQSLSLRDELTVGGQIEAKQGWVSGTAKIAVTAPWIVVAMLSSRPENIAAYNSLAGISVLVTGFLVSIFAYRLVILFGSIPESPRVFR